MRTSDNLSDLSDLSDHDFVFLDLIYKGLSDTVREFGNLTIHFYRTKIFVH